MHGSHRCWVAPIARECWEITSAFLWALAVSHCWYLLSRLRSAVCGLPLPLLLLLLWRWCALCLAPLLLRLRLLLIRKHYFVWVLGLLSLLSLSLLLLLLLVSARWRMVFLLLLLNLRSSRMRTLRKLRPVRRSRRQASWFRCSSLHRGPWLQLSGIAHRTATTIGRGCVGACHRLGLGLPMIRDSHTSSPAQLTSGHLATGIPKLPTPQVVSHIHEKRQRQH
mmetsp:Transcript_13972/g.30883  ORF Transcript_13972/g.30883 Transcript_13972/m.30883 type:complete len:223 (-) Transcript_13972:17-685(-)